MIITITLATIMILLLSIVIYQWIKILVDERKFNKTPSRADRTVEELFNQGYTYHQILGMTVTDVIFKGSEEQIHKAVSKHKKRQDAMEYERKRI